MFQNREAWTILSSAWIWTQTVGNVFWASQSFAQPPKHPGLGPGLLIRCSASTQALPATVPVSSSRETSIHKWGKSSTYQPVSSAERSGFGDLSINGFLEVQNNKKTKIYIYIYIYLHIVSNKLCSWWASLMGGVVWEEMRQTLPPWNNTISRPVPKPGCWKRGA